MSLIKDFLPEILVRFLPEDLQSLRVVEEKATCGDCLRSCAPKHSDFFYKPDLKCCTFYPFIPNFLVGEILQRNQEEILQLNQLTHILPMGIVPPPDYKNEMNKKRLELYGKNSDWLCPFFNKKNQNCSIWHQRPSVCACFYCESSYGVTGQQFWEALEVFLFKIESDLSQYFVLQAGLGEKAIEVCLAYLQGSSDQTSLPKIDRGNLWKWYLDEEKEFFIWCHKQARELSFADLESIIGGDICTLLENVVKKAPI